MADRRDETDKQNPYHWDSITLANMFPSKWIETTNQSLAKFNKAIDTKQKQVDALIASTDNVLAQIAVLSTDLNALRNDIADFMNNLFNAGAYYRIIGFDAEISNNGELAAETRRVLNSSLFGASGTNPDPNFPNFTGDTAQLGGFALLFGAPSFNKIIEQFKALGKYFPGLGQGILGAKEAFTKEVKKIGDRYSNIPDRYTGYKKDFDDWNKKKGNWVDASAFLDALPLVDATDKWHSLTIAKLVPALDPLAPGSPANIAMTAIDDTFGDIQSAFGIVNAGRDAVNKLNSDIQKIQKSINAAQSFVNDVIQGIFDTGLYFHGYGSEYVIRGPEEFAEAIITSVNDTTDPKRPTFEGNTSIVGGIIAIVGGPDAAGFDDSFKRFSNTWKAIGLASESWGKSFTDLKSLGTNNEKAKAAGIKSIVPPTTLPAASVDISSYASRTLTPAVIPTGALVDIFIIKDSDIPPVVPNQTVEYVSINQITVRTQADSKGKVTVTILSNDVVTIKQPDGTFIGTNINQITTTYKNGIVTNFLAGEYLAREDGSVQKESGKVITVFFPDGSVSRIEANGAVSTVAADGTAETTSTDGSKVTKYLNGVVKYYDKNGNLVKETSPEDIKQSEEVNKGATKILDDGSIEFTAPDGTITVTSADGKVVTVTKTNGEVQIEDKGNKIKIIITQNEKTTYYTSGKQIIEPRKVTQGEYVYTGDVTTIENGTSTTVFKDGTKQIKTPDGTITTIYGDGSSKTVRTDGTIRTVGNDGTITEYRKDGTQIVTYTDGRIKQINTDGTFVIINPDGTVQVGKQEGEVVTQNADGTVSQTMSQGLVISKQIDGATQKEDATTGQTLIITPQKITTTQADGTVVEVTDTETKVTDPEGNITITVASVEIGTEIIDSVEREVAFKVSTITIISADGNKTTQVQREPIYDVVRIENGGKRFSLKIPAIRQPATKDITVRNNFDKTIDIVSEQSQGKVATVTTNVRSGEITRRIDNADTLRGKSIDVSSEFED